MPTMSELLEVELVDGVANLTLNRPEKLNALNTAVLKDLESWLREIGHRNDIRAVAIRGAGDRAFSAGADLAEFAANDRDTVRQSWVPMGHRIFELLEKIPQTTIAVIDGIAFGGGLELALACDIRIASFRSRFALPELSIGTVPGWAGTGRLVDVVGLGRARHLVLTARPISAEVALLWGLITEAAEAEDLESVASHLIADVLKLAPVAATLAKHITRSSRDGRTTEILEALAASVTASTGDLSEGISAFEDKRPPRFKGE